MKKAEALSRLAQHADELRRDFGVEHISIFGSVARDEAGAESDVDVLVDFEPDAHIGLFGFARLKERLETILTARVDLTTRAALKKELKDRILGESIRAA